ncbi:MAG TPA: LUD domain-containing protein [Terriglobales bacterium]|nr:LUD domain-containing protein [Terriglobales bacterium]
MSDLSSRERILGRIENALKTRRSAQPRRSTEGIFAPIPDLLRRFEDECRGNLTECIVTRDVDAALARVLSSVEPGEIFVEDTAQFRTLLGSTGPGKTDHQVLWSTEGPPTKSCQATITRAEALIAQTGSLLVSSDCGGRGASVVAPVHIVIAHERQLVRDVEAALELAALNRLADTNSFLGVITGCSRTGDIEKLLVIGAHGPKRLVVIVEHK